MWECEYLLFLNNTDNEKKDLYGLLDLIPKINLYLCQNCQ